MTELTEPPIQKTPVVIGGDACIRRTRIAVWMLVVERRLGMTDAAVLDSFPTVTRADLDGCWDYYRDHPVEIERAIWFNDTAANVPGGTQPPARVLISSRLLGIADEQNRAAFDPPLHRADIPDLASGIA